MSIKIYYNVQWIMNPSSIIMSPLKERSIAGLESVSWGAKKLSEIFWQFL